MKTEKHNTRTPHTNKDIIDSYDYLSNAASKQEMTGLIPAKPASVEELESYEDLFHFLPPDSNAKQLRKNLDQ